jgi:tRNA dimethylallyltransferase
MQMILFSLFIFESVFAMNTEPTTQSIDTLPSIDIRLAPPVLAHHQVVSEIGVLEERRERLIKGLNNLLDDAFNASLEAAKADLISIIREHMQSFKQDKMSVTLYEKMRFEDAPTFLEDEASPNEFAIQVNVMDVESAGDKLLPSIDRLEQKWSFGEKQMFQQACREFGWLTDIVKTNLKANFVAAERQVLHTHGKTIVDGIQLQSSSHVTELESAQALRGRSTSQSSGMANVRVAASTTKWPRMSELIQGMRRRADKHHGTAQQQIIQMQMKLLQAENKIIKDALQSGFQ